MTRNLKVGPLPCPDRESTSGRLESEIAFGAVRRLPRQSPKVENISKRKSNLPIRQNAFVAQNDMKAAAYNMGFGGSRGDATQAMGICWQLGSSSSGTIPGQLLQLIVN